MGDMRRVRQPVRVVVIVAALAALVFVVTGAGAAAGTTRIVGRWTGIMKPDAGSHVRAHRLTVVVYGGERAGTWAVSARCRGTLRLHDISDGYHHYTEIAASGTNCAGGGVDCLKRVGAQVQDEFVSRPGTSQDTTGILRAARRA
jgi:hypothetical protein